MKRLMLLVFFLCLFLVPSVLAIKEVKTISYFGGFVPDASAGTPYSKTFNFVSPDGISALYYAKGKIRADMTTTDTRVYAQVDDEFCTPNYYDIPTNTKSYLMEFDCTNVAHGQGQYEAGFQATKNIKNVYAEWEFTYLNNPPSLVASIGGTEYRSGETSRVVLQILDNEGNPVNDGNCKTTVRDSLDNKVVNNAELTYVNESNAIYFYEFGLELPTGVYSVDSWCVINGTKVYTGDTFHVSEWAEDIRDIKNITENPYISFVGGTEYTRDENVYIRVQYLKAGTDGGTPIDNECCNFNLFTPNLTQIFSEQNMTYISGSRGLYYYDWSFPNKDLGVYSIDVKCYRCSNPTTWRAHSGSTFHVSQWAQGIINMSTNGTFVIMYDLRFAGATEYSKGENGVFVVQFIKTDKGKPNPINNADWCRATFYYPNNSVWQSNVYFPYISGSNGLYYNISTIPDTYGAYTVDAECKKGGVRTYSSDTFHVPQWVKSITDLLEEHNSTVMWKLYKIQDEIASVNISIGNYTANISIDVSKIPKETYVYFQAVEDKVIKNHDYCVNNTHRKELLVEKCVNNDCFNITRYEDTICMWGCSDGKCNPSPTWRILIVIAIIIFIIVIIWVFKRWW